MKNSQITFLYLAAKPYICGSKYLRKMGGYPKAGWCDGVDGPYWQFLRKHESYFLKSPRLALRVRSWQNKSLARLAILGKAAESLKERLVLPS
jgi:deoxyribodipyrimidine photolyase-related protein